MNSGIRSGDTAQSSTNVTGLRSPRIPYRSGIPALRRSHSGSRSAGSSAGTAAVRPATPCSRLRNRSTRSATSLGSSPLNSTISTACGRPTMAFIVSRKARLPAVSSSR